MMGKYDEIPITLHTARVEHTCVACGRTIHRGEKVAYQKDDFINQKVSLKKYCDVCFNEHGQSLVNLKKAGKDRKQRGL